MDLELPQEPLSPEVSQVDLSSSFLENSRSQDSSLFDLIGGLVHGETLFSGNF